MYTTSPGPKNNSKTMLSVSTLRSRLAWMCKESAIKDCKIEKFVNSRKREYDQCSICLVASVTHRY